MRKDREYLLAAARFYDGPAGRRPGRDPNRTIREEWLPPMTERPLIIVGFVPPALPSLAEFQADGTVIFVDEPDVVRKRDIRAKVADSALVRELIEWEYQLPGAADEFFNAHPDLDPAVVAPLQEYATPFAARLAERYGLPGPGRP